MKINDIVIKGYDQTSQVSGQSTEDNLTIRKSFQIGRSTRGVTESHPVTLQDDDLLEMVFEDGTTWFSSPDTLDDLFPEAMNARNRSGESVFEIPFELSSESSERGILNKIALKVLNIFTKNMVGAEVKKLASNLEEKQLEEKIGLFSLDGNFQLHDFTPDTLNKPYLLFIHGTASSTNGSFGELKNTELFKHIQETYGDRVLAFQHRTLTENPLHNVRDLIKALPKNSVLHLITHSRGGLVGELLSRFCNSTESKRGFTDTELSVLKNEYPEAYYTDLTGLINDIKKELENKRVSVEKFIRVACPAGGTTIISNRMDNFFNFTFNLVGIGTGIATNPVYSAFRNLLAAVIDCKNDVNTLPGLEVQRRNSPFIKVLNSKADSGNSSSSVIIDNSLIVISGNAKAGLKLSALLVIASKLFFMQKNDLVVDTESMSLGTRRSGKVQRFFDEETEINHFKYFENKTTNTAMLQALQSEWGTRLPGFIDEQLSLTVSAERNALLKLDGGQIFEDTVTGTKPIVVLLPGIMGSNLAHSDKLIWINYWKFLTGGLVELRNRQDFRATSLIATSYKKLVQNLSDTYDVVTFPFDWRLPLTETAKLLDKKILGLLKYKQPVKLIGHSMGGVLIRDFIATHPDTWSLLNNSNGFRLIFLGAPLGGSFRIPAVLFGKDGIIDKLAKIDLAHSKKELLEVFSGFQGLLSLLPLSTDADNDFASMATWQLMKKGIDEAAWPLPASSDLDSFGAYRKLVQSNIKPEDYTNAVYIAGKDSATTCGYRIDKKTSGDELVFLSTAEGDQSVTWESGIPKKMIENNTVYYVDVTHGSLANEPGIFRGIRELLANGNTNLLSKTRPVVRGEEKLFKTPASFDFDLSPAGLENTLLGLSTKTRQEVSEIPIRVSISHGDLFYASYPVFAGHFLNDGILYAENAIDSNLNGTLSKRHQLGIYPGQIGTSEVILSTQDNFKGAVIIGLGTPGELTAFELTRTIEQGISNYLLHLSSCNLLIKPSAKDTEHVGISSLIIGSGYAGLSIEDSVKAIIQGVYNANLKFKNLHVENTQTIECIEFIELYEDKALSCFYSINRIEKEESSSLSITTEGKKIKTLLGSRKRIPINTSEGWWNRITVSNEKNDDGSVRCLQFNASTGGAREEQQELFSSPVLMEELIEEISTNNRWTPEMAKTIFELLIPNNFKEQLKRHGHINWILDSYTASYPWELLQDGVTDTKPICVSAGMIRQLVSKDYRLTIKTVAKNNALIIADPDLKGFVNQLPGAYKEGKMVSEMLKAQGMNTTPSLNGSHSEIIETLFREDYKIIHLSGHGLFDKDHPEESGMVIGKNLFLSAREIRQMSTVPELVFVNCCFLGKTDGIAEEYYHQRYKLAANLGTQLIDNGVKCVIAAGWAVDDAAALEFARVFYDKMFSGYNFGESVKEARKTVFEKYGQTNTWGAYQCYGDPFYKFESIIRSVRHTDTKSYLISQEAEVALSNLLSEMGIRNVAAETALKNLREISEAVDKAKIRNAAITEYEALIYMELSEYDQVIEKISSLLKMENASYSFSVAEKYCNARAKKIIMDLELYPGKKKEYLASIKNVIRDLDILISLSPTSERLNIMGSTYKRQAFLSGKSEKLAAYSNAAFYYNQGYTYSVNNYSQYSERSWYSLTNWLVIESVLVRSGFHKWNTDIQLNHNKEYKLFSEDQALKELELLNDSLHLRYDRMNYWDLIAECNIQLCFYILLYPKPEISDKWDFIFRSFSSIWKKAGSKGMRLAEIEHFRFIIDALNVVDNKDTTPLKNELMLLKNELEKLI